MSSHLISRDERLTAIETILFHSPEGVRVVELADACQVDRRTIYRDMAKLRSDGVPIYQMEGRFFISREYYLASVQLNVHEMVALFMAARLIAQLHTHQNPYIVSALTKLSAALPRVLSIHARSVSDLLRKMPVDRLFVSVVDILIRAWSGQRWVRVWHRDAVGAVMFAPYFLDVNRHGVLYALGHTDKNPLRVLRIDSILRVELLTETFTVEHSFDSSTYLAGALGMLSDEQGVTVILAFRSEVSRLLLNEQVLARVESETRDDGRVQVQLCVPDWKDMLPFVRSLGADVEVIAPLALRTVIAEEARQTAALYQQSAAVGDAEL